MDDLLELLFDLLGWLLPLIGKFWLVILAFIGYKVFGKGKKMSQGRAQRTLTPVESGGFPHPQPSEERRQVRTLNSASGEDLPEERRQVRASSKYEPIQPAPFESLEGVGVEQEWAFAESDHSVHAAERKQTKKPVLLEAPEAVAADIDPREGMKWAIIFGEPRSKAPFAPLAARRKNA